MKLDSSHVFYKNAFDDEDDGFSIGGRLNGIGFRIRVSSASFTSSPIGLDRFQVAWKKLQNNTEDIEFWAFTDDVVDSFLPQLLKLAPPALYTGKLTLAETLVRRVYGGDYKVVDERPIETPVSRCAPEYLPMIDWDMSQIQNTFPVVDPASVDVPGKFEDNILRGPRSRLFLSGERLFYKSCEAPQDAIAEVNKYCKISASGLQLRISQLHSIVAGRHGQTIGLLYHWIPTNRGELATLQWRIRPDTPKELRERWISQIRETVAALHGLELVWGDVYPQNVLIDSDDNAVITDLQGGGTSGWVDFALINTAEGDLQGLKRLVDFIHSDNARVHALREGIEEEEEAEE